MAVLSTKLSQFISFPPSPLRRGSTPPKAQETEVTASASGERLWCGKVGTKTCKIGDHVSVNGRGSRTVFSPRNLKSLVQKALLID